MDVLNNVNLDGNEISSVTLNNAVVGDNSTTTAGAIKYGNGSLSYYNGSSWVTLGSGGEPREVNGFFNVSDGTSTYAVQVSPGSPTRTVSFTSTTSGLMYVSMMDSSVSRTLVVPTTYLKTTGEINIGTEYLGGTLITITHNLGTYNIIAQVWYRASDKVDWEIVEADVKATSTNVITVLVGGASVTSYSGIYKVLIFRGYEQTISAGNITAVGQGSVRN